MKIRVISITFRCKSLIKYIVMFNRYSKFTRDGQSLIVPFIKIDNSTSDLYITYNRNTMRLDTLSYKYYSDPNYGWLILQANPWYGSMEFSIPDRANLRIPYPLDDALNRYHQRLTNVMAQIGNN